MGGSKETILWFAACIIQYSCCAVSWDEHAVMGAAVLVCPLAANIVVFMASS